MEYNVVHCNAERMDSQGMATQRTKLLASLAGIIGDYQQGGITPITPTHVEIWLKQFDRAVQQTLLIEMESIFWRYYFSRARIKACLHKFLAKIIARRPPEQVLPHIKFLNIQRTGESQRDLLNLLDEVLRERYRVALPLCGLSSPTTYVYLDDAIYTGNRIRYDLTEGEGAIAWIPKEAPPSCRLIIYTLGLHTTGFHYVAPIIQRAAREKRIAVTFYYAMKIENERKQHGQVECLWPDATVADASHVDEHIARYVRYILWLRKQKGWSSGSLTRPNGTPAQETLFSSARARHTVESAFFKAGAQLVRKGQMQESSLRPLGFEVLPSWGFGTFFITYRNIANNCPLALWSTSSGWYPLFPRKSNAQTSLASAATSATRRYPESRR